MQDLSHSDFHGPSWTHLTCLFFSKVAFFCLCLFFSLILSQLITFFPKKYLNLLLLHFHSYSVLCSVILVTRSPLDPVLSVSASLAPQALKPVKEKERKTYLHLKSSSSTCQANLYPF